MSEPMWTRGSWTAIDPEDDDGPLIDVVSYDAEGGRVMIASIAESTTEIEEDEPNIRLIAAAPDLYAALEALVKHHGNELYEGLRVQAELALAKARGES